MALILKRLTAITTSCRGKLLSWKERGILLGEIAVEDKGRNEDERIGFAVEANLDVCLAGATRFGSFHELRLPVTSYVLEIKHGIVTFCKPRNTLPETLIVLSRRLTKYLRRQLDDEDSFESVIEELHSCRTQSVGPVAIEERLKQALSLLETAFEQRLKNRLRGSVPWQRIRAELEWMCLGRTCFTEEYHFNDAMPVGPG